MPLTLITGAPGWIGNRLVRSFFESLPDVPGLKDPNPGQPVRCLVLPDMDKALLPHADRVEIIRGDLRDPEAVRTFCRGAQGATLFHLAGLVHPKLFVKDFFEVNVKGTRNLLNVAEQSGVRRAVVLSSNSPFGTNPSRDHLFDESFPYHPYMGYGRSKMEMELAVKEVQGRGKVETVILRPTWFYGPDQPFRQTLFFRMIRKGQAPIVGDGENLRSMMYVDNLCHALRLSETNPAANGQSYWVSDARPYTMNEIIDTVERLMEKEFGLEVAHKRLRLPSLASEAAFCIDFMIQKLGLYHQKIHVLSEMNKTIACSVQKARSELGYNPVIELEEGMRRSLAWCVQQKVAL
jgi:nucleoside-diphosphate-sugar epimerase